MLTSSRGVFEMPCKVSASPSFLQGLHGEQGPHGTVPAGQRERRASPPGTRAAGHAGLSHLNLPVLIHPSGKRNK